MDRLDSSEVRVLGALLEKEIATPDYYPLSLNALVNACNQKSNREPVVSYDDDTVERALEGLRAKGLAVRMTGGDSRVPKHGQRFTSTQLRSRSFSVWRWLVHQSQRSADLGGLGSALPEPCFRY